MFFYTGGVLKVKNQREILKVMDKYNGTWLMIKTKDDYCEPEFVQFQKDLILHFEIIKKGDNGLLEIKQKSKEKFSTNNHEFLDQKRIRVYRKDIIRTSVSETETVIEESQFATDYVKIEATKTNLTEKEIQELEFKVEWNGEKLPIIFNKDLSSPPMAQINKRLNKEGKRILLENLQGTYFVSIYRDSRRSILLGIEEIGRKKAVLYGFPEKPYKIIASSSG